MSKTIKEQIRVLVKEHERGLLPTEDYRRLRRALLQRAARGEMNAPPEPTVTRPRPPKGAAPPADTAQTDDVLAALGDPPSTDEPSRHDPTNRRPVAKSPPPADPVVAAGSNRNFLPLILAGIAGLAVVLVMLLFRSGSTESTDLSAESNTVAPTSAVSPAQQLAQAYLDTSDWTPGSIRGLTRDWKDLPAASRQDIKSTGWYRELARELRDRLRLSRSSESRDASATTTALLQLADSLDVRVDERPATVAVAPQPEPKPVPKPTSAIIKKVEPPKASPPPVAKVLPEPQPEPAPLEPVAVVASTPDEPVAEPTVDAPLALEAAPVPEPVAAPPKTADAKAKPGQCEQRVGSARSRFCRDQLANGEDGPRLAIVRPVGFEMGSSATPQEQPVHTVTIKAAYAIAINEVSFAQFARFCAATGCTVPDNPWGDDSLPVVNVTWNEATDYARWWSGETGHDYRLPSEAQWEFAARAGTTGDFPFGDEISSLNAHFSDSKRMDKPLSAAGRLIVGNEFGLKHIVGNAREWVADVWHDDYTGAPVDGSPRVSGDDSWRVVRGGSFRDRPLALRSAARDKQAANSREAQTGFRLVRMISGQ